MHRSDASNDDRPFLLHIYFSSSLACVSIDRRYVCTTYGSVLQFQTFACHGTRHMTPDPHDSSDANRRIRKYTRSGERCLPPSLLLYSQSERYIPFRRSVIHPFLSRVRLLSGVETERSWSHAFCYIPNPFYEISGFLATACTATRSPSGCPLYLALHLASNWFSGKKKMKVGGDG